VLSKVAKYTTTLWQSFFNQVLTLPKIWPRNPHFARPSIEACARHGGHPSLPFSIIMQKKVRNFAKRYCNSIDVKLVFSSFKIGNMFSVKDPIPHGLHAGVVCYVSKTTRHFSTNIREHMSSDRTSLIFKHLQNFQQCRTSCSYDCCSILDHASTTFQLKIKEAIHIQWEKPTLNHQLYHGNLKLSL